MTGSIDGVYVDVMYALAYSLRGIIFFASTGAMF
jgi:hypothetical protein